MFWIDPVLFAAGAIKQNYLYLFKNRSIIGIMNRADMPDAMPPAAVSPISMKFRTIAPIPAIRMAI